MIGKYDQSHGTTLRITSWSLVFWTKFLLVESSTVPLQNMRRKDENVTENVRSYISPRMAKWLVEAAGAPKIQKGTKKETLGEDL